MNVLSDLFTCIHTLHDELIAKMHDVDGSAMLLARTYRELPDDENPANNTLIRTRHWWYKHHLEEQKKLQREYDFCCDLARRLLDKIEDGDIAMGLQLYGVNRMRWREVAECLGVPNIQKRCETYLTEWEDADI